MAKYAIEVEWLVLFQKHSPVTKIDTTYFIQEEHNTAKNCWTAKSAPYVDETKNNYLFK